jgi:hypothetical protein
MKIFRIKVSGFPGKRKNMENKNESESCQAKLLILAIIYGFGMKNYQ